MALEQRRRALVFTPTQLALYAQCPERYYRKYVKRQHVEEDFSPSLAKGSIAHTILAECFESYRRSEVFPPDIRERVEYYLPRPPYLHDRAWLRDVEEVVNQVEFALLAFDRTATVLATEATYEFKYPGSADCPSFILRAKIDRVARYNDRIIEHSDYKTGSSTWIDPIQNIAARIVIGQHFRGEYAAIRSSTVFLAGQAVRTEELTRERVQATWQTIKQIVSAILAGQNWQPVRSNLCSWCPYYDNGCSLCPAPAPVDELVEWLDSGD